MTKQSISQDAPAVGTPATIERWTHKVPATVIAVEKIGQSLYATLQEDNAVRTDNNGLAGKQEYDFSPDPEGELYTFRLRNGEWERCKKNEATNRWKAVKKGYSVIFGKREKLVDFSV